MGHKLSGGAVPEAGQVVEGCELHEDGPPHEGIAMLRRLAALVKPPPRCPSGIQLHMIDHGQSGAGGPLGDHGANEAPPTGLRSEPTVAVRKRDGFLGLPTRAPGPPLQQRLLWLLTNETNSRCPPATHHWGCPPPLLGPPQGPQKPWAGSSSKRSPRTAGRTERGRSGESTAMGSSASAPRGGGERAAEEELRGACMA